MGVVSHFPNKEYVVTLAFEFDLKILFISVKQKYKYFHDSC